MSNKRRTERHLRNREKDRKYKEEAWSEGKLILENHNSKEFTPEFSVSIAHRLYESIVGGSSSILDNLRQHKDKVVETLILYNPEAERDKTYLFLKDIMNIYWDNLNKGDKILSEFLEKFAHDQQLCNN